MSYEFLGLPRLSRIPVFFLRVPGTCRQPSGLRPKGGGTGASDPEVVAGYVFVANGAPITYQIFLGLGTLQAPSDCCLESDERRLQLLHL